MNLLALDAAEFSYVPNYEPFTCCPHDDQKRLLFHFVVAILLKPNGDIFKMLRKYRLLLLFSFVKYPKYPKIHFITRAFSRFSLSHYINPGNAGINHHHHHHQAAVSSAASTTSSQAPGSTAAKSKNLNLSTVRRNFDEEYARLDPLQAVLAASDIAPVNARLVAATKTSSSSSNSSYKGQPSTTANATATTTSSKPQTDKPGDKGKASGKNIDATKVISTRPPRHQSKRAAATAANAAIAAIASRTRRLNDEGEEIGDEAGEGEGGEVEVEDEDEVRTQPQESEEEERPIKQSPSK
jgi:hypothetical protein